MTRRSLLNCLFALVATISVARDASADPPRFAVVTMLNQTPDVSVTFLYRWGNGPWMRYQNFGPGAGEVFSIPLDPNGQAPSFEIMIDEAIGAAPRINKTYQLPSNHAPAPLGQFGHKHAIIRDQSDNMFVDVYDLGP
jgi:hypothetical protein